MENVIQTMHEDASGTEAAGWYTRAHFHRDSFYAGPPYFRPAQEVLGYPANNAVAAAANGANQDIAAIEILWSTDTWVDLSKELNEFGGMWNFPCHSYICQ